MLFSVKVDAVIEDKGSLANPSVSQGTMLCCDLLLSVAQEKAALAICYYRSGQMDSFVRGI